MSGAEDESERRGRCVGGGRDEDVVQLLFVSVGAQS